MTTPLPKDRGDREYEKFKRNSKDEVAVKVIAELDGSSGSTPIDVSVASPKSRKIQTILVGDTAVKIPLVPFTKRIFISIANLSQIETLYIGNSDVIASRVPGDTGGWEIGPEESYNENIDDAHDIYAIASPGKSILIKIQELSSV